MNETHFAEVEATLLYVGDARERATRACKTLRRLNASPHLIVAMEHAEHELRELTRSVMQGTYFAVIDDGAA